MSQRVAASGHQEFTQLRRVAVMRSLSGLGDLLCIIPALRSLRVALPQAEIVMIGLPQVAELLKRFNHYVNRLLIFPGYPGLPEQTPQLEQIAPFLTVAQSQQFDLAIQMQGNGVITNPITVLLGARSNAGFYLPSGYCPDPNQFLPYQAYESEVQRYLRLMDFLGMRSQGDALEFPLLEADYQAFNAMAAVVGLQYGRYVCVHPGASVAQRCWSPEKFAIVADALADNGFQIILTGTAAETSLTQTIAQLMRTKPLILAGHTNLGTLAVLLKGARLLICNDTGVSHLAAALQVPSVVVFTHSNPTRWAPLDQTLHRVVHGTAKTAVADVIAQATGLLESTAARIKALERPLQMAVAIRGGDGEPVV